MQQQRSSDEQLLAFWQTQLQESTEKPWLASLLLRQSREIGERCRCYYQELRTLPLKWRRAIRRRFSMGLAGAALLMALSGRAVPSAHAANIITVDGTCTLADAITAANDDIISGSCSAGAGADVLDLQTAVNLTSALPVIESKISIKGNDNIIQRSGGGSFSVLEVTASGSLTLNNLTIQGGSAPNGGGIYVYGGTLNLNRSTVSSNSAEDGGGVFGYQSSLTIYRSTISGNNASGNGGGLDALNSTVVINDSTISGNTADYFGGGIYFLGGNLSLNNSTVSGNSVAGSYANSGGLAIVSNTFTNVYSHVSVNDSTISGNSSPDSGGGINNISNSGGTLELNRSIISGNSAPAGAEIANAQGLIITADNFNIIGYSGDIRSTNFTQGADDIVPSEALGAVLNPTLSANGGRTLTHALVSGSPAIDIVPNADAGSYDQRGAPRRADGDGAGDLAGTEGDAGSFEYGSEPVAITIQSLTVNAGEPSGLFALAAGGLMVGSLSLWQLINKKRGTEETGN